MTSEKLTIEIGEGERLEFLARIIDEFEEFLDDRGIELQNPDKTYAMDDGQDPDEIATIYGDDFAELEDRIMDVLKSWSRKNH